MEPLFGRYEAAALLAVDRANGGELAPLEQVIGAFEGLFGQSVTAATFAESLSLLIDARLIDWGKGGLELTIEGRRFIRRAGSHWDQDFPDRVAEHLSRINEEDLAPEGELPAPTEDDILGSLKSLGRGGFDVRATGGAIAPSGMAGHHTMGARLTEGLPLGYGLRVEVPGMASPRAGSEPSSSPHPTSPEVTPPPPLVPPEQGGTEERDQGVDGS